MEHIDRFRNASTLFACKLCELSCEVGLRVSIGLGKYAFASGGQAEADAPAVSAMRIAGKQVLIDKAVHQPGHGGQAETYVTTCL